MNHYQTLYLILSIVTLLASCDKPYNDDIYSKDFNIINNTYFVGDIESGKYYDYEPDLEFELDKNYIDTLDSLIDSVDLDLDGSYDFSILRKGKKAKNLPFDINNNSFYFGIITDYYYGAIFDSTAHSVANLEKGDILYDILNWWTFFFDALLIGNVFYDTDTIQNTASWEWNKDEYFSFKYFEGNYCYLGWVRIEFISESASMKIKDCGIKTIKYKYLH